MGSKRPFDGEEIQKLPFKILRPIENDEKMTSFTSVVPNIDGPQKLDTLGEDEDGLCQSQCADSLEGGAATEVSTRACKDLENNVPVSSWVSRSPSTCDVVHGPAAYSTLFSEYFESNITRRVVQYENLYSSLLDQFPQKQVPVGPENQADVPVWCPPKVENKDLIDSDVHNLSSKSSNLHHMSDKYNEDWLMGTCIISMPDSNLTDNYSSMVGGGRKHCYCLDRGSVRCVRQHVREAREELMKMIGEDKFMELGFLDMGEEVARKWSDEEEHVFHEVVFANPASLSKNFWVRLSATFPSRTMAEIVSYYFNVFMLRKRAAQNRSDFLDIDSDDDELHSGSMDRFNVTYAEEEDSDIEFPVQDNNDEDEGSSEDGDDYEDDDVRYGGENVMGEENEKRDYVSETNVGLEEKENPLVHASHQGHVGSLGDSNDTKDDTCLSVECPPSVANLSTPAEAGTTVTGSGLKSSKCFSVGNNELRNEVGPGFIIDTCDSGVWGASYSPEFDLLSTSNMIEEIFGPGSWNEKSTKDGGVN